MKNNYLIFSLLFVFCLFITGCGSNATKEVATLDVLSNIAANKNFNIKDNDEMYADIDYILGSKTVYLDDISFEMVVYDNVETATKSQDNHVESFNLLRSTGAHETKDKGSNYYSYKLISNDRYMFTIRVENTLLFGKVLLEDKEIVEEIIKELGY